MKRVLRRWMAMLLAVLMVMGTLPTTAWAARIEDDAVPAIPVVDEKDGVVDTLAKSGKDDDVTPINPVDPDPQPGDLNFAVVNTVTVIDNAFASGSGTFATATTDGGADEIAVLIVPRFSTEPNADVRAVDYEEARSRDEGPGLFAGYYVNNTNKDAKDEIDGYYEGMPYVWMLKKSGSTEGGVGVNWAGQILVDGEPVDLKYPMLGSLNYLKKDYLSTYITGKTFYEPNSSKKISPETDGLPFDIFIAGSRGYNFDTVSIKVSDEPLKVEILDANGNDATQWHTKTILEETTYPIIRITNQTLDTMTNVEVTLNRGAMFSTGSNNSDPANWGETLVEKDEDGANYEYIDGTNYDDGLFIYLRWIYGLDDVKVTQDQMPYNKFTIPSLAGGDHYDLPIVFPKTPDTSDIEAWNTAKDVIIGWDLEGDNIQGTGTDISGWGDNLWSNYTVVATYVDWVEYTEDDPATGEVKGGIHWAKSLLVKPKIVFVNSAGREIPYTQHTGAKATANGTTNDDLTLGVTTNHVVRATGKYLDWIADATREGGGYYGFDPSLDPDDDENYVQLGDSVFVNGTNTSVPVQDGAKNVTKIPMYTVTVTDDPEDAAQGKLGAYMVDNEPSKGKTTRVEYLYYPVKAMIGVYAAKRDGAFVDWNEAVTNKNSAPAPLSSAANGSFNISGDTDVIAYYNLVKVNFLTTWGGKTVNSTREIDRVYSVRILDGTKEVAAYRHIDGSSTDYEIVTGTGYYELTQQTQVNNRDPWSVTLPGGKSYTMVVNGLEIETIDTTKDLPVEGQTGVTGGGSVDVHYVIELAGVQPKIVNGNDGTTMHVPHDQRIGVPDGTSATADGNEVIIPNKMPDGKDWPVLYYPVGGVLEPWGNIVSENTLRKLTYVADDDDHKKAASEDQNAGSWSIDENVSITVESGADLPLTATFGATGFPVTANINLDAGKYTGLTVELVDAGGSTTPMPETPANSGTYYVAKVNPGVYTLRAKRGSGSYVTIDTIEVTSSEVTAGAQFWTVKASVLPDGKGKVTMTPQSGKAIYQSGTSTTADSGIEAHVLDGATVTWVASDPAEHYQFKNWDGAADKTDPANDYKDVEIKENATKVHVANFEKIPYTVTFEPEGGTWPSSTDTQRTKTVKSGDQAGDLSTSPGNPAKDHYSFGGWYTAKNGGGTQFTSTTTVTADITVYAKWTYTISYDLNAAKVTAGSVTSSKPGDQTGVGGDGGKTAAAAATATLFNFVAWNTAADGTGTSYGAGTTIPEGTKTLYAQWARKTKTLTVQVRTNGSNGFPTDTTYASGLAISVVNKTTAADAPTNANWTANSSKASETHTVQLGDTYTVSIDSLGYSEDVTIGETNEPVYLDFATISIVTNGHGTAKAEATLPNGEKRPVICTESTTAVTMQVIETSTVKWTTTDSKANYTFSQWDNTGLKTLADSTVGSELISHEAKFTKSSFDTYLDLKVNTVAQAVAADSDDNVKEIKLTYNGTTYSTKDASTKIIYNSGKWGITGVTTVDEATGTWTVITKDGGTYTVTMEDDGNDTGTATMELFGVKVVDPLPLGGTGAGVKGKGAASGLSAEPRVIVPRGSTGEVTPSVTVSSGFKLTGWAQATTTPLTTVTIGTAAPFKVTLSDATGNKYTNTEDLVITPVYTFSTTIEIHHKTTTGTKTDADVMLTKMGETTAVKSGTTSSGVYAVSDLTPGTIYDIWVNGFKVGAGNTQITANDAGETVPVIVFKVTTARNPDVGTSNVGLNAAGTKTEAVVPNGAKVTTTAPTVNAAATVPSNGYRKRTTATDGAEKAFWEASAGTVTTADGSGENNTTTWTIDSMTDDVTLTAHYVQQFDAKIMLKVGDNAAAANKDRAYFTKETNSGAGTTLGNPATTATVDKDGYVVGHYVDATGQTLKSWTVEKGTLYEDAAKTKPIADGADTSVKTVYFFPNDAGAQLTANVVPSTYYVKVYVNKDNDSKNNATVELHYGTNKVAQMTYNNTDGCYVSNEKLPFDTTYTIFTNVEDDTNQKTTGRTILFTADEADEGTNTSATLDYYTIKVVTDVASPGAANSGNTVQFVGETASTSVTKTVLASTDGGAVSPKIKANPRNSGGDHYVFTGWTADYGTVGTPAADSSATYSLPALADLQATEDGAYKIDAEHPITITAHLKQQFQVTVKASATNSLNGTANVRVSAAQTVSNWTGVNTQTVTVDAGQPALLYGALTSSTFVLSDWTIDSGEGTFKNVGHTESGANSAVDKGYLFGGTGTAYTQFTPTKDTVLQLNGWKKPTMTAGWKYDIGTGDLTSPKGEANGERRSVLTTYTDSPVKVATDKVKIQGGPSGSTLDDVLTLGTDYTVTGNNYVMVGKYLEDNTKGTATGINYHLHLTYDLGPDDHYNKATLELDSANFTIYVSKHTLSQVDIQVEDGPFLTAQGATPNAGSPTANANVDDRDAVCYEWHEKAAIPKGQLKFTWYYGPSAPAQKAYEDVKSGTTVTKSAEDMAKDQVPTTATEITSGVTSWTNAGATIDAGTVKVTEAMKGMVIFAVVHAEVGDGKLGQGAVITNAIPVDYDATVTIEKNAADNKITGDYDHYTVYLVPESANVTAAGWNWATALANGTIFQANHVDGTDGDGVYTTKGSKLNANTKYYVYVNDVESGSNYVKADNTLIERTKSTKTVRYYTITLTDVGAATTTDETDDLGNNVGEVFDTTNPYPSFTATVTGTSREVDSGSSVLSGTKVTVTSSTWSQDYTLTWKRSEGVGTALGDTSTTQSSGATAAVYDNGAVNVATNFGGKLKQNTYVITGNIVADGNGRILTTNEDKPTLTYKKGETTYTFKATEVGASGGNGGAVKFKVPRSSVGTGKGAIEGEYTLTATPVKSGLYAATLRGYRVPAGVWDASSSETTTSATAKLKELEAGTSVNDGKNRFTIFIEATNLSLNVRDEETDEFDNPHGHSRANNTSDSDASFTVATGRHIEPAKKFGNTALTKTITVTNNGNTKIKVTPTLQKFDYNTTTQKWEPAKDASNNAWAPAVDTATKVASDDLGKDKQATPADKVVTFSNWEPFTLDPKGSYSITVTFPSNLENEDDARYRLVFTGEDGRDGYNAYAPTLWFEVELTVDPVTVDTVSTEHPKTTEYPNGDPNVYTVKTTTIKEDASGSTTLYDKLQKPQDANGLTSGAPKDNNDLVYEWYTAAWDAEVKYDTTTGKLKANGVEMTKHTAGVSPDTLTYELQEADKGKILYLLVKGRNNATGAATTPDVMGEPEPPMQLPYTGTVYVQESPNRITSNGDDGAPDYTVYLWNTKDGANPTAAQVAAGGIPAKWDNGKFVADGLLAKDPENLNKNTYQVWANTVKGGSTLKNTGKIIDVTNMTAEDVIYYSVTANETTYDNTYVGLKGDAFFGDGSVSTGDTGLTPGITVGGATLDVANGKNWVMAGTDVTLAEAAWNKDYTISWTKAAEQAGSSSTAGSSAKITAIAANTVVDTKLTLNLYDVEAYVVGMGYVNYIDMVLVDGENTMTFTSKTDSTKILGIAASKDQINASNNVGATFRLPKSETGYTTTANVDGMTVAELQGYRVPHADATLVSKDATFKVPVTAKTSFDVVLQGQGQQLTIVDDVPAGLGNEYTDGPESKASDFASITPNDGGDGTPSAAGNAKQTIRLNYNYTTAKTVVVTASNTSKQDENADEVMLYNVKFTPSASNGTDITMTTPGDFDATTKTYTLGKDDTKSLTLEIPTGLKVGTHTYTGDFTFTEKTGTTSVSATVHYTLEVIVQPLTFTYVDIHLDATANDGTWTIKEYSADRAAVGTETAAVTLGPVTPNGTANQADPTTALKQDPDYGYQWISTAPTVTTPNIASVSPTGALTSTGTPNYELLGTGKTYKPRADDEGRNLYLVIYGKDDTTNNTTRRNATGFVVSEAKSVPYDGIVYFNKDDGPQDAVATAPGYTVQFISDGGTPIGSTWKQVTTGGAYAYVSDEGLEPGKTYTVKVSRAEGDATNLVELTKKLNGTNVGKERAADPARSNVAVVDCYTVNAVKFSAQEFKGNGAGVTGEKFDHAATTGGKSVSQTDIAPQFTIGTGANAAALDSGKSVLKGQKVVAKAPAMSATEPNNNKAWTQDYTLTWQDKTGNGTFDNTTKINDTDTVQNAVDAVGTGYAREAAITAKTYIGGRLDQNTYQVVGTVRNPTGLSGGSVKEVTLAFMPETGDARGFTFKSYKQGDIPGNNETTKVYDTGVMTSASGTIYGAPGDTITFTVVQGKYKITAKEGDQTTMQYVTIGGDGDSEVDPATDPDTTNRYEKDLAPAVADDTRLFSVYVAQRKLNLGLHGMGAIVDEIQAADVEVATVMDQNWTVVGNTGVATAAVEYYYNGNAKDASNKNLTYDSPLTLTNPVENGTGDLEVWAEVWRFDKLADVPSYTNASAWTGGNGTGSYTDNKDGVDVLKLTDLPTAASKVFVPVGAGDTGGSPAKAGGDLAIDQTSTTKANAVYVIRYSSVVASGEEKGKAGPTVFYVLDLTVKPLPIREVEEPVWDATAETFKIPTQTDASRETLNDVKVYYKDKNGDQMTAADTRGLIETDDVLYVWATAPRSAATLVTPTARAAGDTYTLSKSYFTLADGNDIALNSTGTAADVKFVSTPSTSVKAYAPQAADQGRDLYLLAVRSKKDGSNATDFAISTAVYAPVEVTTKAYRTNTTNEVPGVVINPPATLPDGTVKKTGADNVYMVSQADTVIPFTPDVTDDKTDPVDEPSVAKYYFVGWGVDPEDAATAPTTRELTWEYPVTKKSTVIGYYDLLPKIDGSSSPGYNTETGVYTTAAVEKAARTLVYNLNDGSGDIEIEFVKVNAPGDTSEPVRIPAGTDAFEELPNDGWGAAGKYVLSKTWRENNLEEGETYTYTFYDKKNGVKSGEKGYAGYDPTGSYQVFAGEKMVVAQVNTNTLWGTVTISNTNPDDPGLEGPDENSVTLLTYGGSVKLLAEPKAGYVFKEWTKDTEGATGTFGNGKDTDASADTTYKGVKLSTETVIATFDKGELSMEDLTAKVIYGSQIFVDGDKNTVAAPVMDATSTGAGEAFTYTFATSEELADEKIDATNDVPGWLKLNTNGSFGFNGPVDTNVQSSDDKTYTAVDDELVVYVTATAAETGEKIIKKLTIDVLRGTLEIAGEAFTVPDGSLGGDPVDLEAFTYTSVTDQAGTQVIGEDNGKHDAKGTWAPSPKTYIGNDRDDPTETGKYKFTFTYGPKGKDEEKWNYEPASVEIEFHVDKPPQTIYIADKIENGGAVVAGEYVTPVEDGEMTGKDNEVPVELKYSPITSRTGETITYLDDEPSYTVRIKGEGNLYRMSLTEVKLVGFAYDNDKNEMPTLESTWTDGQTLDFKLLLAPMSEGLWKGLHEAEFTVTGYKDEEPQEGETPVTATYKLNIEVLARPITKLDVTVTDPEDQPDTVTPTLDGGKTLKDDGTDDKGIAPIKETTVTWGPADNKPDGKHTEVTVKVEIDPNYVYVKDDPATGDKDEDITENTELTVTGHQTPRPDVERDTDDEDHIVHITQLIPYLMHDDVKVGDPADSTGPMVAYGNSTREVKILQGDTDLGSYEINLGAYGIDVYDVVWTVTQDTVLTDVGAVLKDSDGNDLTWGEDDTTKQITPNFNLTVDGDKRTVTLDLSAADTSKSGRYYLTLEAAGKGNDKDDPEMGRAVISTYTFVLQIRANNPPSPSVPEPCPCKVFYYIGANGTTTNPTVEDVNENSRPSKVPAVTPVDGYTFRGWSLTNPATLKSGEQPVLVDPKTVTAKGETMTFYAVIQKNPYHEHYIIGYPNGNFGPGNDINRAAVATIIARAILPDFVEGANYGNPGGYSDVSGHWAESAIAYCSKFGVFEGMPDGTFQPNRSITRQEFALVIARLDGVLNAGEMDFTDIGDAGTWALGGIYTAYVKGWVNGYPDGSFKPLNNISRAEAVKVFNAYLKRGVDADGLRDLHEYVYPDKNTGNDFDQYRTWPDVPANYWAYYDIIEASNDHAYEADMDGTYSVPEKWTKCWIDERWGGTTVSADAAMVSAGFQVWLH